jgi:hypothetical protein
VSARIAVFTLGGTIAMVTQDSGGVVPALTGEQLIASVPGLSELGVNRRVYGFRQLLGASLSLADLRKLADVIDEQDVDGVVVTQGIDTIEESAYVLDLLHQGNMPTVVTGMHNPMMAEADGPANQATALGGNVQFLANSARRLVWASPALPGAMHDLTAARRTGLIDADVLTFADRGARARAARFARRSSVTGYTWRSTRSRSTAPTPASARLKVVRMRAWGPGRSSPGSAAAYAATPRSSRPFSCLEAVEAARYSR